MTAPTRATEPLTTEPLTTQLLTTQPARSAKSGRPAKTLLSAGLLVTVAVLTLSGCGGSGSTAAPTGNTSQSAKSGSARTGGAASQTAQQDADQIEGAVNDAQSTLDGLDQDFAGDNAAGN